MKSDKPTPVSSRTSLPVKVATLSSWTEAGGTSRVREVEAGITSTLW